MSFANANIATSAHTITWAAGHGFGTTGKKNLLFTKTAGTTSPTGLVSGTVYQFTVNSSSTLYLAGITDTGSADFVGSITNSLDITNTISLGVDVNCTKANQVIIGPDTITETLLRAGVCIGTSAQALGYALTVGGATASGVYVLGDVNADQFTDHSDAPESLAEAYAIVQSHEVKDGKVDHSKLHSAAWGRKFRVVETGKSIVKTREIAPTEEGGETTIEEYSEPEKVVVSEPDQQGRNLSMTISALTLMNKDLLRRIEALEAK
jgi:hypothetical protein